MNSIMDLHTHTIVSGHAYCTLREMTKAAAEKGLQVLGITEHAPAMPGSTGFLYFHNLKVVPRELYGVRLLLGAEVNIIDYDGKLDLRPSELKKLDIVIASMHMPCIKPGSVAENTRAYVRVIENPLVDIIGHPDDGRYPVEYRPILEAAKAYHKVIELNNTSLNPMSTRSETEKNNREILSLCMEYQVPIAVNSDAHFDTAIGEFSLAEKLLDEMQFPEELILNRSWEALKPYLHKFV